MEKNLQVSVLLDFYGEMLTQKQRKMIELYYDNDLSLSEIADNEGITRQGVRDSIKRGEAQLFETEERLGLAKRFTRQKADLERILQVARNIEQIAASGGQEIIRRQAREVSAIAARLCGENSFAFGKDD